MGQVPRSPAHPDKVNLLHRAKVRLFPTGPIRHGLLTAPAGRFLFSRAEWEATTPSPIWLLLAAVQARAKPAEQYAMDSPRPTHPTQQGGSFLPERSSGCSFPLFRSQQCNDFHNSLLVLEQGMAPALLT